MENKHLSANTLFHFTSNMDNIINILSNYFSPRYCMENYKVLGGNELQIAIPMVCFCDIPLAQIKNHIQHYGGYAIGLSKEWGISKGINPVIYSNRESLSTSAFRRLIDKVYGLNSKKTELKDELSEVRRLIEQIVFYIKPYEGQAWDNENFNGEYTRFYDEREWRYIPDYNLLKDKNINSWLEKKLFLKEDIRNESNIEITEVLRLDFKPEDIKYIIVNSEDEILKLCDEIDKITGDNYTGNQIKVLKTRIISKEQILSDF